MHGKIQKTREGCGCFRGLFGGSRGKLWESPRKIAGLFSRSRKATNSKISGTGKGKPAGNPGPTLPGSCLHLPCAVFFEIDSSSLLEFFPGQNPENGRGGCCEECSGVSPCTGIGPWMALPSRKWSGRLLRRVQWNSVCWDQCWLAIAKGVALERSKEQHP